MTQFEEVKFDIDQYTRAKEIPMPQTQQFTKQGVRNLNKPNGRRDDDRPRDPCTVGLHNQNGQWTSTADGYCQERRCPDCGEITGFEAYYGSR